MQYTKPPLSYEEQADLLISRGLQAEKSILIERLQSVNYYRLSGYLYPFRTPDSDMFRHGTSFDTVWNRYTFDRHLRLLLLDALERFEVAFKTELTTHFTRNYGPFGYLDIKNLPLMDIRKFGSLKEHIKNEVYRSREVFIEHFKVKYGDSHQLPPLWMAVEVMSFGTVLSLFRGLSPAIKQGIARRFAVHDNVFESWVTALNAVRNICAHHSRVWNRELGYKPKIPKKQSEWRIPAPIENQRIFGILTILSCIIKIIAPQSRWQNRFHDLLSRYPGIPQREMGMPDNWRESPFWKTI